MTTKTPTKRKLTLHRETLRAIDDTSLRVLEGVVGGTSSKCTRIITDCDCDSDIDCQTITCNESLGC